MRRRRFSNRSKRRGTSSRTACWTVRRAWSHQRAAHTGCDGKIKRSLILHNGAGVRLAMILSAKGGRPLHVRTPHSRNSERRQEQGALVPALVLLLSSLQNLRHDCCMKPNFPNDPLSVPFLLWLAGCVSQIHHHIVIIDIISRD